MSSTKFHPNPMTLVRVTNDFQLKERKSTFEIPADSKSTYIPLSRYQNAIPLRLSSYSQGSICIYSPHTPPNFIQIQRHSSELHSISDSKSTYIPLSCHQNAIPSDLAHFYRVASQHTCHTHHQISASSITTRPSYTRFYAHPKNMNFLTPSD